MKTQSPFTHLLLSLVTIIFFSCDFSEKDADNILLKLWTGPFKGVPAFDQVIVEDVEEAMLTAMALHLREIETIANDMTPPSFENTIVAMESSGAELKELMPITAYYQEINPVLNLEWFRKNWLPILLIIVQKSFKMKNFSKGLLPFMRMQKKILWKQISNAFWNGPIKPTK